MYLQTLLEGFYKSNLENNPETNVIFNYVFFNFSGHGIVT